jgi:hypothetical protein
MPAEFDLLPKPKHRDLFHDMRQSCSHMDNQYAASVLLQAGSWGMAESHGEKRATAEGKLTRINTDQISPSGCADRTGGECSRPGTPGSRGAFSGRKAVQQ